jgi:hypothetical protein
MLYADFYFRMKRRDAVCIAGWTQGEVVDPVLLLGEVALPATGQMTHLRGDLPAGARAFILRFDLGGEILDVEGAKLRLGSPAKTTAFPAASAHLEAMIGQSTDETFVALLLGVAEGLFAIEEASAQTSIHKRAYAVAAKRHFAELPGAAVAHDAAVGFESPDRVAVTGWMGDDGSAGTRTHALVLDGTGTQALTLTRNALIRPDLSGLQMRNIELSAASGYIALGQLARDLGPQAVALVGMIHEGLAIGTLRQIDTKPNAELGRHYDQLRRSLTDPERREALLAPLLPVLPDYAGKIETVERPADAAGAAVFVLHDLDPWLGRDVIRLLRRSGAGVRRIRLMAETSSEALIRSVAAERIEAGAAAAEVELMRSNLALGRWAPEAQHLIFAPSSLLFLPGLLDQLASGRAAEALCLIGTDRMEPGFAELSSEDGIAALQQGQPFAAQIDQARVAPGIPPRALNVSPAGQMRWFLLHLAQKGRVRFVEFPVTSHMPGRDPLPYPTRAIELRAMKQANSEAAQ